MKDSAPLVPLTPAVFYILLSLATGQKHGYEIMKQVRQDSNGNVKMGNGTLYGSLKRMLEDGLIQPAGEQIDPLIDERRIYYTLTDLGRRTLNAELKRYTDVVSLMRKRKLNPTFSKSSV